MRIGVDVDGVLTDLETFHLERCARVVYEKCGKEILHPDAYDIKAMFDLDSNMGDDEWLDLLFDYAENWPARPYAAETIRALKDAGHEIYIVTARLQTNRDDEIGEKMRRTVTDWLCKNGIVYDKIFFRSPVGKLVICKENHIDVLIDDSPRNVTLVSEGLPVLCFDARYNRHCAGENIIRCFSWFDVYTKIKAMEK